jgi:hypothetical protein
LLTYFDLRDMDMPVIIVQLELIFGFDECGFGLGNPGCDSVTELIDRFVGRLCTVRLEPHLRELTSVCHEQNLLCQGVHVVVICKLGSKQELILVVLFVAHEDTDKLFKLLVDGFGLAVSLQVGGSGGCGLYTNEAPHLPGEFCYKLWPAVRNVLPGSSVVLPDVLVAEPGGSDSSEASVALDEVDLLTEDVNYDLQVATY